MRTAYVYRAFDADGRLLYIGSSIAIKPRMAAHERQSPWWLFHTLITLQPCPSLAEARDAEVAAIGAEHPRWNVQHRSPDHPDGPIVSRFWAPWLRDEINLWIESRRAAA